MTIAGSTTRVAGIALAALAGALSAAELPRFPPGAIWYQNVAQAPLDLDSQAMIGALEALGGFGNGRMQIDFGLHVVRAAAGAPMRVVVAHHNGYWEPDCEPPGTSMPVPPGAAIEGETGLDCDNDNEDCHLLVVQDDRLYEAYSVTAIDAGTLEARCLAVWELDYVYPPAGRGDHCTSADAAGFPMTPLLFNADEIAAALAVDPTGDLVDLGHAVRFILPNERIATDAALGGEEGKLYVRPASHAGGPTGPVGTVPYGARLRLVAGFPRTGYNPAARVLLNTFEHFGLLLADGGSVALTAESDLYTTAKWDDLGVGSRIFDLTPGATDLAIGHFAVVATGPRIAETYNCVRTELSLIFADGFEPGDTSEWSAVGS
jgi:serine/threonine-protein kinase